MRLVQPINDGWLFRKCQPDEEWQKIDLPHTYNAIDGQDGSPMYRGPVIYKKTLDFCPEDFKLYYLEVGAASLAWKVFVNGTQCSEGACGFSLFRVRLNGLLKKGENVIEIHVTNGSTAKLYPAMADFSFYGGLYRGVSLITEDSMHFTETDFSRDGIILTPEVIDPQNGILKIAAVAEIEQNEGVFNYEFEIARSSGIACHVRLLDAGGAVVAEDTKKENATASVYAFAFSLPVMGLHLWDGVADPYLYTVEISLLDGKGKVYDVRRLMTGFRTIEYSPEKGMLLNGHAIKLNGVAKHQDFAGIGNAVTAETMDTDMKLIREIGANSIRCSHYQHPDDWYDLCDRTGLLVWAEIPVISVVAQNPDADKNAFNQLEKLIAQSRNHCSIYCWGVQNETCMGSNNSYTHDLVRRLAEKAKRLDPSRMTAQANEYTTQDNCPILDYTDISGHNLYYGWYYGEIPELQTRLDAIHQAHPATPLILTEYGVDTNVAFHSLTPKANDYTEEYQLKFHQNALRAIDERPWMAGGYVWNMFDFGSAGRDEGGTKGKNQKGLVTIDRKIKKDAFYLYKAHWSKEPFVYIAGRRFKNRPQAATDIMVLSNMEHLSLIVNRNPIASMKSEGDVTVFHDVPLLPGQNSICVTATSGHGATAGGATTGGATSSGSTSGGSTTGSATTGGATAGGATTGGATAGGATTGGATAGDRIILCRVAEPDPSYVLQAKEKVVVDWFAGLDGEDFGIKEEPLRPEGFTFDDIIQDIYDNDQARGIFLKFLRPLTLNARFEGMKPFMTVKKLIGFANNDNSIPEALLKHCEQELNKIDK